jgi:hypothetical protein
MASNKDARDVLTLCAEALRQHHIGAKDARLLSSCAIDYTKLTELHRKQFKKTRFGLVFDYGIPSIRSVRDLLHRGQYSAAIMEANQLRSVMDPLIKSSKRKQ